jgi:hypothetical protein
VKQKKSKNAKKTAPNPGEQKKMGAKTSTPNVGAAQPNNSRTFSASTSNFPGSELNGSLTGQQLLLRAIQYNQQNQQQNIAARRSVPNLHDHHGNSIAEGEMAAETSGNAASGSNPLFRYATGTTTTTTSLPASMLWSLNGEFLHIKKQHLSYT